MVTYVQKILLTDPSSYTNLQVGGGYINANFAAIFGAMDIDSTSYNVKINTALNITEAVTAKTSVIQNNTGAITLLVEDTASNVGVNWKPASNLHGAYLGNARIGSSTYFRSSNVSENDTVWLSVEPNGTPSFGANILYSVDNIYSLGSASFRASEIFAANGTINTSDEREKTRIIDVAREAKEALAAQTIKADMWCYKWNDAIVAKGEANARFHFGVGAQSVGEAFEAQGLNPADYGLFCYDEFPELIDEEYQEEVQLIQPQVVDEVFVEVINGVPVQKTVTVNKDIPVFNHVQKQDDQGNLLVKKDGSPDTYAIPVMTIVTKTRQVESGTTLYRYGLRYNELWAFLMKYV